MYLIQLLSDDDHADDDDGPGGDGLKRSNTQGSVMKVRCYTLLRSRP